MRQRVGRAAFDQLVGKLSAPAALPFPLRTAIVRVPAANAFAIPGGRVYVFEGMIGVRTVLQSSYSRETEAAAGACGARLVETIGGDAAAPAAARKP